MVTRGRECLFGEVNAGEMHLSDAGRIVWAVWNDLPGRYAQVTLGAAVVMPNHFHEIVTIHEIPVGAIQLGVIHESPLRQSATRQRRRMTLPLVVGYFKMNSAKRMNETLGSRGIPVWQRNYYEHIIRNDDEYNRVRLYIEANPVNWPGDDENPEGIE